jgi:predicted membrane-bound spermidine synthase
VPNSRSRTDAVIIAGVLGLFTIGVQTALMRDYLVLFRGSELALGFFFGAWFLGVALGATLVRKSLRLRELASDHLAVLLALHPLVALAGHAVLSGGRVAAGIMPYESTPTALLIVSALAGLGPFGILTGIVFPAVCDRSGADPREGASRAYIWESAGAVLGGAIATVVFLSGVSGLRLTALVGLGMAVSAWIAARGRPWARVLAFATAVACSVLALPPTGEMIERRVASFRLNTHLAGATLESEIETPYGRVTTARVGSQMVVLEDGQIIGAFPPGPDVDAEAALLASQPAGRVRAAVLGTGRYSLAAALGRYFDRVYLVAVDGMALDVIHGASGTGATGPISGADRVRMVRADPRSWIRDGAEGETLDLVVVATGEPSTLLSNRLYTSEFLGETRRVMAVGGVVAAFARSGENALAGAVLRYGQSLWRTLDSVFGEIGIVPGEEALLLASPDPGTITLDPMRLEQRYRGFVQSPFPFPPEGFVSLVHRERSEHLARAYSSREVPGDLVNRDSRPLSSFLFLLAGIQRTGEAGGGLLWRLFDAGPKLPWAMLFLTMFILLRARVRATGGRADPGARVLLFVAGGASVAGMVSLLAAYQAAAGAVYGEIGAVTAIFMTGLVAGAALLSRLSTGRGTALVLAFSGLAILGFIPIVLDQLREAGPVGIRVGFGGLFLAVGALTGAAWPVAATLLGPHSGTSQELEAADHWGAALLAPVTGVVLLTLYGLGPTFAILAGLFGSAATFLLFEGWLGTSSGQMFLASRPGRALSWNVWPRGATLPALAMLVGVGAVLIGILGRPDDPMFGPVIPEDAVRRIEPRGTPEPRETPFPHHLVTAVTDPDGEATLVASAAISPETRGYGGRLNVAVSVGDDGRIRNVVLLGHRETASYLRELGRFLDAFRGQDAGRVDAVDTMTGATVTANAVQQAVGVAGRAVAGRLQGRAIATDVSVRPWYRGFLEPVALYAIFVLIGAALVHRWAGARVRLAFLGVNLILGGMVWNLQLSAAWLQSLGNGVLPSATLDPARYIMTVGVLLLAVVWGPLYCAHACPFGAAQEIAGRLGQRLGIGRAYSGRAWQRARALKYALLVAVCITLLAADPGAMIRWDPLGGAFSRRFDVIWGVLAIAAILASLVWFRFWCRVFCPVGAFLNLFNRVAGFMGIGPARRYAACDLGVTGSGDIDCIQCNRCVREPGNEQVSTGSRRGLGVVGVLVVVVFAAWIIGGFVAAGDGPGLASGGSQRVRKVNMEEFLRKVQEGRLSDREADWWVPGPR